MQEYIDLNLFHHDLAQFSSEELEAADITPEQQYLIEYMANQEVGHIQMFMNMLGLNNASKPCTYAYPFTNVRDSIDFLNKIMHIGESNVLGFLAHLHSRVAPNLVAEAITIESKQEMVLRQMNRLFPMPVRCSFILYRNSDTMLMFVCTAMVQLSHFAKYAMDPNGSVNHLMPINHCKY
jgi:hypothetical protein